MSQVLAMNQQVTLHLTFAEALILSDCVNRLTQDEGLAPQFDKAEQVAVRALDAVLERWNPVIFSENYSRHLQDAKSHIMRGMDE